MIETETESARNEDVLGGMTPKERSLRSRLGGLTTAARGHTNTAPARAAFAAKWELEVDPEGILAPAVRAKRAEAARRVHMTRMALLSAQARRRGA